MLPDTKLEQRDLNMIHEIIVHTRALFTLDPILNWSISAASGLLKTLSSPGKKLSSDFYKLLKILMSYTVKLFIVKSSIIIFIFTKSQ